MHFSFSEEQESFRRELSNFLRQEMSPRYETLIGSYSEEQHAFGDALARKLAEKGWLAVGWPEEYAGGGKTAIEQAILDDLLGYLRVPKVGLIGLNFAGPAILRFGSPEQKAGLLPPIARGQVQFCQGFSEPNAGSDLASLQTRAVRDGDEYVITGAKMFTSYYAHADYIYLLARTNPDAPKHRGISLFIFNVHTPGVTFQPLHYINEEVAAITYLDNVRVPATALVGEENQGWYHAMTTLDFERAGLFRYATTRRVFDDFVDYCRNNGVKQDPVAKRRLAELNVGMEGWRWLCWKVAWAQAQGELPNAEASVAFLHGTELRLKFAQTAMDILGPYGVLTADDELAPIQGAIEGLSRESLHLHGAGTTQVHRNIIAQRGLGLPR